MSGGASKGQALWRAFAGFLGLFFGLCALFALVVTIAEAWQEHSQARWPEVTARVSRCRLDQTSTGRRDKYYIHCQLSYAVGAEQNLANIYSSNVPSPDIWQYPPNQIAPFEEWVEQHPAGTPVMVHYDPASRSKVALVTTDMPRGGPRTPSNLKLLAAFAVSSVLLLALTRITRQRSEADAAEANG
jgi:hypothetical protein